MLVVELWILLVLERGLGSWEGESSFFCLGFGFSVMSSP
jgi:hypothetical protein